MTLDYIVCYDGQAPTAWVTFTNPAGGTSSAPVPITDPDIIAAAEALHAMIFAATPIERSEAVTQAIAARAASVVAEPVTPVTTGAIVGKA